MNAGVVLGQMLNPVHIARGGRGGAAVAVAELVAEPQAGFDRLGYPIGHPQNGGADGGVWVRDYFLLCSLITDANCSFTF